MCGRFTLHASKEELFDQFELDQLFEEFEPRYNIAPGQRVLAIIHDGNKRRAGYLKWGLVPGWAKDPKIGYKMINARSESAHQKPSFKQLLSSKRCLIIADSFYEWKRDEKGKQPKRIAPKNRKLFAFAGLWDKWTNDEEELFTCTILTQDANDFMKDIHDRMPVILPKEKEAEWLEPKKWTLQEASHFLAQVGMEDLEAYNVSPYVNAARNEGEACIEPLI
ncbi:SOS response-associated peptidase [Radiobacillus kanasensis]|uniref:SOS response-associated peptidase n=1 Tax=Radiobacillus kanasensis TaxID=2844358 RepID=UPI001E4CCB73|nr:SOS response-associated peptidase [Radiobacillus kanasensis]UFU00002.1 SOS response-associated peptidase [Radiobacillus kanasensis]